MASKYLQDFPVPNGFPQIMHDFTRDVLKYQPQNIIAFAAQYFQNLAKKIPSQKIIEKSQQKPLASSSSPYQNNELPKPALYQKTLQVTSQQEEEDRQHGISQSSYQTLKINVDGTFQFKDRYSYRYQNTSYVQVDLTIWDIDIKGNLTKVGQNQYACQVGGKYAYQHMKNLKKLANEANSNLKGNFKVKLQQNGQKAIIINSEIVGKDGQNLKNLNNRLNITLKHKK